jgi:hypothetical protein
MRYTVPLFPFRTLEKNRIKKFSMLSGKMVWWITSSPGRSLRRKRWESSNYIDAISKYTGQKNLFRSIDEAKIIASLTVKRKKWFKISFWQSNTHLLLPLYVRGLLPASFNDLWITNEAHRARRPRHWFYGITQNFLSQSRGVLNALHSHTSVVFRVSGEISISLIQPFQY